jgi:hypothetical protein
MIEGDTRPEYDDEETEDLKLRPIPSAGFFVEPSDAFRLKEAKKPPPVEVVKDLFNGSDAGV